MSGGKPIYVAAVIELPVPIDVIEGAVRGLRDIYAEGVELEAVLEYDDNGDATGLVRIHPEAARTTE